jgi:hypothetical protein
VVSRACPSEPHSPPSTPEEQAWPVVLLNSPRCYVTGEVFNTDGGFTGALITGRQKGGSA